MTRTVAVVPYNKLWPQMFEDEANLIRQALGSNCIEIHHIGSTSVPGLSAKPIIDVLPVVLDILVVDKATEAMEAIGYTAKGEYGIPFRRFFQKGSEKRTHHVHVFQKGNPEIERHLYFRDWMRTHLDDCKAYENLKKTLAEKFPNDITSYCAGKDEFIAAIDTKAGFKKLRIVQAVTNREWQAVHHFRQKYFFDKIPISDPYTWTFDHKAHIHFVLYLGTIIIGYCHIQLWDDNRAALRIIVIDEEYRNQGMGSCLLENIEVWLRHQGIAKLQIQSSQAAYHFYLQHDYIKMAFDDPDNHGSDPRDIEIGKIL